MVNIIKGSHGLLENVPQFIKVVIVARQMLVIRLVHALGGHIRGIHQYFQSISNCKSFIAAVALFRLNGGRRRIHILSFPR
jgi:hypothetical protein